MNSTTNLIVNIVLNYASTLMVTYFLIDNHKRDNYMSVDQGASANIIDESLASVAYHRLPLVEKEDTNL